MCACVQHNGIIIQSEEGHSVIYDNMDLEGSIVSEINQKKTHTVWYHFHVESKKAKCTETETRTVVSWKLGEEKDTLNKVQTSSVRWISSGELIYSIVIRVNNTVLHNWKLLRES